MKTLVLGSIPDNFSPSTHLPLGPWCFVGREEVFENWESLDFELDPFTSPDELDSAAGSTSKYANALVPELAEKLNSINGTGYSTDFWRILVMPYLLSLIQSTWERQVRLREFLVRHKDESLRVEMMPASVDWNFTDTSDFINRGVLDPAYNAWIFSRLLENNVPASWVSVMGTAPTAASKPRVERSSTGQRFRDSFLPRLRCKGVYGIGRFTSAMYSLALSVKPPTGVQGRWSYPPQGVDIDLDWMTDVNSLIWRTIPAVFMNLNHTRVRRPHTKKGKMNLVGGELMWFSEGEKLRLAHRREGGERIVCAQHGGNYGTLRSVPLISELEYKLDGFITWGWDTHEDYRGNFHPRPSPLLSRKTKRTNSSRGELILIGTFSSLFSFRFDSVPQALQQIDSRTKKSEFLESLMPRVFEHTAYRPYPQEGKGLSDGLYFKKKFPSLTILDGTWERKMLGAKLLVIDHPVTSLNIALSANLPTIGYWDNDAWQMSRQAAPFFERLEDLGVFFQNGTDAARKVNEVWDDVENWWNQDSIQKARRAWCDQYARTSKTWWFDWARVLWNL